MTKTIKFIANNNELVLNLNEEATLADAVNAFNEATGKSISIMDVTYLNDTDITAFVEEFAGSLLEHGDVVNVDVELESEETANQVTEQVTIISVTITEAGSSLPIEVNVPANTDVMTACSKCCAKLTKTAAELTNYVKFINDVEVNNNAILHNGDAVTVAPRNAGVKGSSYELTVMSEHGCFTKEIQGALLRLTKRALINSILVKEADTDLTGFDYIIYDGCTLDLSADFTKTLLDTPMSSDVCVKLECAADQQEEVETDEDEEFFDEDDHDEQEFTAHEIIAVIPGSRTPVTFSIDEHTTVADVVTSNRMLALTGFNPEQALNMDYTVNDVRVDTDYVLNYGDTLEGYTRNAGVKGICK